MKAVDTLTAFLFLILLSLPLGSLMVAGYSPKAQNKPDWSAIAWPQLLGSDDSYRDDFFQKSISNSVVGIDAVAARSFIDYRLLGFVSTDELVSGKDGWLFFRPAMWNGVCFPDSYFVRALETAQVLKGLAAAAHVDLRFSISPDKEIVHPEMLGDFGRLVAGCKLDNSRRWREIATEMGVSFIDHLEAYAARPNPEDKVYAALARDRHRDGRLIHRPPRGLCRAAQS